MSVPPSRLFLGIVPWYGLLIALGAALAVLLAQRESVRFGFPEDGLLDLALWVLPMGILGARIYYVLFSLPAYREHPLSVFYLWEGGLAIYGGLIAGAVTIIVFCAVRRLSLPMMLDFVAPGVALAQAIGRWGNYFNQEAYGLPLSADSPLSFFPLAVQISESSGLQWHVATFFLESFWNFCVFLFLRWARRRRIHRKGDVFLFYLLLYSAGRHVIEELRMDSLYAGGRVRVSQMLGVLLCLLVLTLFLARGKRHRFLSVPVRILSSVSLFYGLAVLLFCLNSEPFAFLSSVPSRLLFLTGFSLICIFNVMCINASDPLPEVPYADYAAS